jgi:PTH1 family peptidyl-tRNA hydrolase
MSDDRFLVVGLGNPGPRYAATRHNLGYAVVELLALRTGARFKAHRTRCDLAETRLGAVPVVLAKPHSFMNESGGPVHAVAAFFKVPVERIVVVHDDLDLPFGTLRLKRGGGEGGHNGLKSISAVLGSKEYARVRLGIDRPPGRQDPADYVLREFPSAQRAELAFVIDRAADAVEALVTEGLDCAQNTYNE